MSFLVKVIGQYTKAEENSYRIPLSNLSISMSGLEYLDLADERLYNLEPYLSFGVVGNIASFKYNHTRENWVIQFDQNIVREGKEKNWIQIKYEKEWLDLPKMIYFPKENIPGFKKELQEMLKCFHSPLSIDRLRLETGVAYFIKYILDHTQRKKIETPVAKLKRLMEEDVLFEYNIEQLSKTCQFSADHLRVLFLEEYNITPVQYRNYYRMQKAMNLVACSDLNVSQMAQALGFLQTSHFCSMFKKHFSLTPKESIDKNRYK